MTIGVTSIDSHAEATAVDRALATAFAARRACRDLPAHVRMSALRNAAASTLEKRETMARTIVTEGVKTIREARREVDRCHDTLLLAAEEARRLFAPVATIEPVDGLAEAERRVAGGGAMINSAIFTNRLDAILSWHNALDAGATIVNDSTDFRIDAMPFGGNGSAGLGREGIRFAIEAMTEPKLICIRI